MRKLFFILAFIFIFCSFFILNNCKNLSEETASSQNITSNQKTVDEKQIIEEREKKKQSSKLYPYFFDYPTDVSIEGEMLNALFLAIESFMKDSMIPERKKNLKNYKLDVKQDNDYIFVLFQIKKDPDKYYVGGESEDAVEVTFFVSKKDGSIKRAFHK